MEEEEDQRDHPDGISEDTDMEVDHVGNHRNRDGD